MYNFYREIFFVILNSVIEENKKAIKSIKLVKQYLCPYYVKIFLYYNILKHHKWKVTAKTVPINIFGPIYLHTQISTLNATRRKYYQVVRII